MAALLTLLAIVAGGVVGLTNGGRIDRILEYRPQLWQALAGGLFLQLVIRVAGLDGSLAVVLEIISALALLAFTVSNVRLGGMVLVVAGLSLNLIPTVINWGMPTSRDALVTADIISASDRGTVKLEGARHVATDDDTLTWLGETIALPTGQVISFGDTLLQFCYLFVTASLLRGRVLRQDGGGDYRRRIAPLGQGPARRHGPGLHPSRLDPRAMTAARRARGGTGEGPEEAFDEDE